MTIVSQTITKCVTNDHKVWFMAEEADEKKKRVIHTRVPESLERELRQTASSLGVSVSNLVRNVLQNTFGLVEGIVADSARVAESARKTQAGMTPPEPQEVIGWQELVLNLNAVCSTCNLVLPKGSQAAIAVTYADTSRPVMCLTCLEELKNVDE